MIYRSALRVISRSYGPRMLSTTMKTFNTKSSSFLTIASLFAVGTIAYTATNSNKRVESAGCCDTDAIKKDIADAIAADAAKREDGSSMAGTLIRLAWHAAGTYSKVDGTGGSNGSTMRFPPESEWGANAGLKSARDFLEPIKQKYPNLSYADLWTLAGVVAIEDAGGPKINWKKGRKDADVPTAVPDGRLPAADSGCPAADVAHIRDVFGRMGFSDREMVALLGAHCMGRCHTTASGYWGPWTNAETTFSNDYFRLLVEEKWTPKKTHMGKKWTGPAQFENKDGSLMMLPADLALVHDPEFKKIVTEFAGNEEVFFKEFSGAFGKLMELGVPFEKKCCGGQKKSGLFGLGFLGL